MNSYKTLNLNKISAGRLFLGVCMPEHPDWLAPRRMCKRSVHCLACRLISRMSGLFYSSPERCQAARSKPRFLHLTQGPGFRAFGVYGGLNKLLLQTTATPGLAKKLPL